MPLLLGVATASQKFDAASALIGRAPSKSATSDAIIVVHSAKTVKEETAEDDPNLTRIREVPMCYPLLKGPASLSNGKRILIWMAIKIYVSIFPWMTMFIDDDANHGK